MMFASACTIKFQVDSVSKAVQTEPRKGKALGGSADDCEDQSEQRQLVVEFCRHVGSKAWQVTCVSVRQ